MHRDDPTLFPDVGAVVKTMDAFVKEGLIRSWGVSNWTFPRVQSAVTFAEDNNLCPPTFVSPQFSLASPLCSKEVWPGTSLESMQ